MIFQKIRKCVRYSQVVGAVLRLRHPSTALQVLDDVPVIYVGVRAHTPRHQLPQHHTVRPLQDKTITVKYNHHCQILSNTTINVKYCPMKPSLSNKTITVKYNHQCQILSNKTITVKYNHQCQILSNKTITVK